MADLVFSAATAAATRTSATPPNEARTEFGAVPYECVLSFAECKTLEHAAHKLARLDAFVHVLVRDARSFRHGKESDIPSFSLRVHPSLPVAEIRDMIQEKFTELSTYSEARDGCLRLLFDNHVLENDKPFAVYLTHPASNNSSATNTTNGTQSKWANPYAGVVWVIPFRPVRTTPIEWTAQSPAV